MKTKIKIVALFALLFGFIACNEEDNNVVAQQGDKAVIVSPEEGTNIIFSELNENNPGLTLVWNHAKYSVATEVNYTIELAKGGNEFQSVKSFTTTKRQFTWTVADINLKCLELGLTPFVASSLEIRIISSLGVANVLPVISDKITIKVTPYGCLSQFAIGAALTSAGAGWTSPISLICDDNILRARTNIVNNSTDFFGFYTVNGDSNSLRNYTYYTNLGYKISSVLVNAGDTNQRFKFNGVSGVHNIVINEIQKSITVAQSSVSTGIEPTAQWLVGAATPGGWSWTGNNETELPLVKAGVFETIINFKFNEAFRVWTANDGGDSWGSPNRNYPWYISDGYTIDTELVNALDGDSNFRYTGATGVRRITINSVAKTIVVD